MIYPTNSAKIKVENAPIVDLNLHPAAEVVAEEVGGHGVQHVHLVGLERHSLLVEVIPGKNYNLINDGEY